MSDKMREALAQLRREASRIERDQHKYAELAYSPTADTLESIADEIEAALAEQPAQGEAVAWYDGNTFYANTESASMCCADMSKLRPVYYAPPAPAVTDDQAEYLLNLCRAKPDMGNKAIIAEMREVFAAPPTQPEQRGEVVASVKESLTVRAAFEAWLAWWSTLPNNRDENGYCDMTVDMLSHAYAAGMTRSAQVGERGEVVPIKQFRVKGAAAWNDGIPPTHHYETRTLYTDPPAPAVPDGWHLVPTDAPDEMLRWLDGGIRVAFSMRETLRRRYAALLAAAPEVPRG